MNNLFNCHYELESAICQLIPNFLAFILLAKKKRKKKYAKNPQHHQPPATPLAIENYNNNHPQSLVLYPKQATRPQ